jgi:hypothetical protein
MEHILFNEEQKFKPLIVWLISVPAWCAFNAIFAVGLYKQLQLRQPWGDNPMSDQGLIIFVICMNIFLIGLFVLFIKTKLITEVRDSGIYYSFPPFIIREKKIAKEEIERVEVRKYNAIKEYGGWGVRQRKVMRKSGIAYNVSGSTGLQLYLKSGKKILFGTQRKEAIESAMNKMLNPEMKVY